MKYLAILLCLVGAQWASGNVAYAAGAPETAAPRIEVVGAGTVSASPDRVVVDGSVIVSAPDAATASAAAGMELQRVLDALAAQGVRTDQIQTREVTIYEDHSPGPGLGDGLRGTIRFRAQNGLRVWSDEVDAAGELVDVLVTSGINQLSGVSFEVRDPVPYLERARRSAVQDAQAQALVIADELGLELGAVVSVAGGGGAAPRPEAFAVARSAVSTPVLPGMVSYTERVRIVYTLRER